MAKSVLITGSSRGIGRVSARAFANAGYRVGIHYQTSEKAARLLFSELAGDGCAAALFQADVGNFHEVKQMLLEVEKTFGTPDVLVNNAGISEQKLFTDLSEADWDGMMRTNVKSLFNCCHAAVPGMIRRKTGRIINISSIWGRTGASMEVHYSTSKAAVIGFTKALAKELGPSGITVNCIAPGLIDTDMNRALSLDDRNTFAADTPLGRLGTPEEVAESILFFASDAASFITGQVLGVDGGYL